MSSPREVTSLLRALRAGDAEALDALFPIVYDELYRLARLQRRRWRDNHTLNTTALVHEAYLKLVNQREARWNDRVHFFAVAATAMRHILINYAQKRRAAKRGGPQPDVPLDEVNPVAEEVAEELLALDAALKELAKTDERQHRIVECRFFAGLTIEETAAVLGISTATVKRDWRVASAWLYRQLRAEHAE